MLLKNETILNTAHSDIIDLEAGSENIACVKNDLTIVLSSGEDTGWSNIYDIAYCGNTLIGIDTENTLHKYGNGNFSIVGLENMVKISGSSNYLLCVDVNGNSTLCDSNGNQELIWETNDIIDISVSDTHCLGLTKQRTVVTYSTNNSNIIGWEGILKISSGNGWSVGVTKYGEILLDGSLPSGVSVPATSASKYYFDAIACFNTLVALYLE